MDPQRENQPAVPLRASDADREAVAGTLRDAAAAGQLSLPEMEDRLREAYRARTIAQLQPLTQDLPVQPAVGPAMSPIRIEGPIARRAWAVMSTVERRGRWTVPGHFEVGAVMGSVRLDLRQALFEHPHISVTVYALMGNVDIVVPDDLDVFVDGTGVMGSFESRAGQAVGQGRGSVRVLGFAVMGSVRVRAASKRERRRAAQGE